MRKQTDPKSKPLKEVLEEAQTEADAQAAAKMPVFEDEPEITEPDAVVQKARAFYQKKTLVNAKRLDHLAQNAVSEPVKLGAINAMNDRATGKPTQEIINRNPSSDAALEKIVQALRDAAKEIGDSSDLHLLDITPVLEHDSNHGEKGGPTDGVC